MREVVESAKEATDHDKKIERMKRGMFAANTKAAQFPEAEVCARQKPSKKKKSETSCLLSDKQRHDAEKEYSAWAIRKRHKERSTAASHEALSIVRLARTVPHHLPSPLSPLDI